MPDWIDRFLEVTDGNGSPEIFRLWAGISAVAGSMERRCWVRTSLGVLYPNLYIMLVAPPGCGKTQAINPVIEIWQKQANLHTAPESMTKAALIDSLAESHRALILPDNKGIFEYNSLQLAISELGVLISSHDLEFLSVVNAIFDNNKVYRERRRSHNGGQELQIVNPQLNIISGTQPAFLSSVLPEESWGMGFTSRFLMIFSCAETEVDIFGRMINREEAYEELADAMRPWTDLYGQFSWDEGAVKLMRELNRTKIQPQPDHPKLEYYRTRRLQFLIRLCMVSAMSRTGALEIGEFDVERARHWLLNAEAAMPNAFNAMSLRTDAQLLDELHVFAWKQYALNKHAPLPMSLMWKFLSDRVFADRVPKIIDTAIKSGLISDLGMDTFKPEPVLDLGGRR